MSALKALTNNEDRVKYLNSKAQELSDKEAEDLVADYDAALVEFKSKHKVNTFKIKFKGKVFEMPNTMPFSFSMFYLRNCVIKKDGKTIFDIPDHLIAEFIERMFGKDFIELMSMSDDVDIKFVVEKIIPDVFTRWGYVITKEDLERKNRLTPA